MQIFDLKAMQKNIKQIIIKNTAKYQLNAMESINTTD